MSKVIFTNKDHLLTTDSSVFTDEEIDAVISINPAIKYQRHMGFGGALTDAACISFNYLNESDKEKYLKAYFSEEGLNYNLLRYPLGSCDFSTHNYHYLENEDINSLSIDCDKDRIAMYQRIQKYQKDIVVFASPWSPPSFMKSNGEMNHGGKLIKEYYSLYSRMLIKAIKELKNKGVNIQVVTTQNEPLATQVWDSCIYTGKEEAEFVSNYLLPAKKEFDLLDLNIGVWDHNRDVLIERIKETFSTSLKEEDVQFVCFHWYSKSDFEQLDYIHENYPSLHLVMSEGCVELLLDKNGQNSIGDFAHAEVYIHQIINDLNHYTEGYIDWNLSLDSHGGPNHVGNYCEAPIMISESGEMKFMYSYYAIAHFAHFIKVGAYRIFSESNNEDLDVISYENPNKTPVIIIFNHSNNTHVIADPLDTKKRIKVRPHTIYTIE